MLSHSSADQDGVLVIDKPQGPTSHDVVSRVKRIVCAKKVGHLGTLDPAASGVLPLVINGATKRASELAGEEKVYEFTLCLGSTTDTDDDAGKVLSQTSPSESCEAMLREEVEALCGECLQRPPRYSAIKVDGKRAYALARKGIDFELPARPVRIDALEILGIDWPLVRMRLACCAGTYVRSICRDLGERIGCGGHAKDIKRLRSGRFDIAQAITLPELEDCGSRWQEALIRC